MIKRSRLFAAADVRDMPRVLAFVLLGAGNIASGILGLLSHGDRIPGYTYAAHRMPLTDWWVGFIALGLLILAGPFSRRIAMISAVLAFGFWLYFADFVWQAHQHLTDPAGHHLVSLRGAWQPAWMAALHLLLTPYTRRVSSSRGQ